MSTATASRDRSAPDLDEVFAALSNATRRSIVRRLAAGSATISELAAPFDMSLPAVSKHIIVLERAGVVTRTRDGKSKRCSLETERLSEAEDWISSCRAFWEDTLGSLASYFEVASDASRSDVEEQP